MLCLLKGYKPEKDLNVMALEAHWPRIQMVTESADPPFLAWLAYNAQQLGLHIVQRQGATETTLLNLAYAQPQGTPMLPGELPAHAAFRVRIEVPPDYPPEAAGQLSKKAIRLARELQRRLGYPAPKRLRMSPLVSMAEDLRVAEKPLPSGASYDIIDKTYRNKGLIKDMGRDRERRALVKSRRHKLRKRLVKPYEKDTGA